MDEKEELVTERDVYRLKYDRLNKELHYILKGDERRVLDIDALIMENRCIKYRLQHCLEWVIPVYTSKLTSDSVVTYLFHDCECSLWLFCLVWHVRVIIKVQYTSTDS